MATPIRIKRSAVSGKKPQNTDLQVGELALNTYDGSLFTKRDTGGVGIATTVSNITPWVENFGGTSINYSSGNVGIGSDNPTSKLDINGSLNVSGISTFTGAIDANGNLNVAEVSTFTSSIHVTGVGSSVGIGTTTPTQKLEIYDGRLVVRNTTDDAAKIVLRDDSGSYHHYQIRNQGGTFHIRNSGATPTQFNVISALNTGNVGINSSVPTARLDVVGNTKLQGDLNVAGVVTATGDGTFDDLRIGEWHGNASYGGVFHKNQDSSEYMMISNDSHTYISATTGSAVIIRGGNNVSTNQITVSPTSGVTITAANGVNVDGNATFQNNVSIAGTLTYEDVTNIDSIGIITAQSDVHVGAGLSVVGIATFSDDVNIEGINPKLIFTDTNGHPDYNINCEGGKLYFNDSSNNNRILIEVDGHIEIPENLEVGAAITMGSASGIISAAQFHGDGANITGISTLNITNYGVGLGGGSIAGINTEGTSFFNQLSVGNSYPAGISSFFSYQHNGGLDLLVAPTLDDQSTRLRIQSKDVGGNSYDWYLESERDREQFKIIGGSTSWITIGGVSGGSGKVGINSTDPTSQLDVVGDVKISGIITATSFVGSTRNILTQNTTLSGSSMTFDNIPTWATKITVNLLEASLSGSDQIYIRLRAGGSSITSDYNSVSGNFQGNITSNKTDAFNINTTGATQVTSGSMVIEKIDSAGLKYVQSNTFVANNNSRHGAGALDRSSGSAIDGVELTTENSDTFDAGTVTIYYE